MTVDRRDLFLSMDTSGPMGSAALARREVTAREEGGAGTGPSTPPVREEGGAGIRLQVLVERVLRKEEEHAALLVPRIGALLEEVGARREELGGIVLGAGPGSFTGVRVAAATAKAMAWALKVPLWAFSSLAAGALTGPEEGESPSGQPLTELLHPRCVLFDARGDRVYAAAYRVAHGALETLLSPTATTVFHLLEGMIPPGALLMGEGATRHRVLLAGAGYRILPPPAGWPSARGLLRLLELDPHAPPLEDPGRWEPDYLRASGAERLWKTRKGMGG